MTETDIEWRPRTPLDETSQAFLAALYEGDEEAERYAEILNATSELARLHESRPLVMAAVEYAARGIPVFPCKPKDKRPLIGSAHPGDKTSTCKGECGRDGHGVYDATTDTWKISDWWTRWPEANIGTPTGRTFDVYDVDGPHGVEMMWGYYPVYGCRAATLNVLAHVSTPSDGGHHLYVPPVAGKRNGVKFWEGMDYRGLGGYVVVPPSIGANGRRYVWIRELN